MKLKIKILNPKAQIPSFAHQGDAGFDLYSCEDFVLNPGQRHLFKLGFATEFPEGYVGIIKDRSGLALKQGLTVLGGVIDSGYRGEWGVILLNTSDTPYQIKEGERIAQVIFYKVENVEIEKTENLSNHSRGEGGFGSTGK